MKTKIVILLFISCLQVLSQEIDRNSFKNTIGIKHSNTTGYGVFFNRRIGDNTSIQFQTMYIYYFRLTDEFEHKNINVAFGMELQQNIFKNDTYRSYFLAGGYYYFDDDEKKYAGSESNIMNNNSYNIAFGLGFEYHYNKFLFSAELGYKFYQDNKEITMHNKETYPALYRETKLAAGVSVGFIF